MTSSYYSYWAKTDRGQESGGPSYHLLPYHCLDVAAVGYLLLDPKNVRCQRLASQLEVESEWLRSFFVFCLSLHDLGKFARSFQGLQIELSDKLVLGSTRMPYSERHDSLGFLLWKKGFMKKKEGNYDWLKAILPWVKIVFGHHGMPPKESGESLGTSFKSEDRDAAWEFTEAIMAFFLTDSDFIPLQDKGLSKRLKNISWQLAGLSVLADWSGSNRDHFSYCSEVMPLGDYWQIALDSAGEALDVFPKKPSVRKFTTINRLFSFINKPTPLQEYAVREPLADSPHLFILEDVTGAGKTEAGLILTHRLLSSGLVDGLYVALPTMATANAMYRRLGAVYRQFYGGGNIPSLVLAHGAREMSKEFRQSVSLTESNGTDSDYADSSFVENQDLSATAFCNTWLADSKKKALLADVGVGTIDQALLAVLPARHQSLRLLGLVGKVLLVDEVHAYDSYMFKLLESLLEFHARQGGSVVLLSATLPYAMREKLVAAFEIGLNRSPSDLASMAYPLVTHISATEEKEQYIDTREEVKRLVEVRRIETQSAIIEQIQHAVKQGECVCWIRNTVQEARNSFQELTGIKDFDPNDLHLFHSRFAMVDRQRIEEGILDLFGKNSGQDKRAGQVLVATQVVEQSLDLDFDMMITDLAPIDLIIQRAGRLCRHVRDKEGNRLAEDTNECDQRGTPVLFVLAPEASSTADENWLQAQQPGTQAVYPHLGRLWLTTELLFGTGCQGQFAMPGDARPLIEGVYSLDAEDKIPELMQETSWEADGKDMMQLSMAHLNILKLAKGYSRRSGEWGEESRVPTRLVENETVSVVLAIYEDGKFRPYAGKVYLAWAMSTVKIPERQWLAAQKTIPASMTLLIEELKTEEKALRWLEVFPLYEETCQYYQAEHGWQPEGV